jgi:hyperosmotically inducible periplasmic protein
MRKSLVVVMALAALVVARPAGAQISDRDLFERVADAINGYANYGMFDAIEVGIENRVVTLSGWVTTPVKRDDIVKRVQRIDGIRSLSHTITVLPVSRRDDEMRHRVASAIYNNPMFWMQAQMPVPPIHIIVDAGRITLTGVAENEGQRTTAVMLAQRVPGNFGVTNLIKVPRKGR